MGLPQRAEGVGIKNTGSELVGLDCPLSLPPVLGQTPAARGKRENRPSSAWLSSGLEEAALCGQDLGCGEGRGRGRDAWWPSSLKPGLVLTYRLALTLILPCGPPACPQASPPFLVENRKFCLCSLHAAWGKHTIPHPRPHYLRSCLPSRGAHRPGGSPRKRLPGHTPHQPWGSC